MLCICALYLVALDTHAQMKNETVYRLCYKKTWRRGMLGGNICMINRRSILQNIVHITEKILISKVA